MRIVVAVASGTLLGFAVTTLLGVIAMALAIEHTATSSIPGVIGAVVSPTTGGGLNFEMEFNAIGIVAVFVGCMLLTVVGALVTRRRGRNASGDVAVGA